MVNGHFMMRFLPVLYRFYFYRKPAAGLFPPAINAIAYALNDHQISPSFLSSLLPLG
jgi:hypothetical protein